ncbi:hypothetical protein WJX74_008887 [Apatococcus lobatus]|uniref:Uncharacterized protein n=1 Tax=Apatococcus lobatus TaxID=904363 RepID=A0AAW1S9V2_9CHLO
MAFARPQAQHADENAAENRDGKPGQGGRGLQAQGNQRRALGDIGNVVSSYNTRRAAAQKDAAVKRAAEQRQGPAGTKLPVGPVTRRAAAAAANQELRASKPDGLDEEKNLSVSALLQKRSDAASPVSPLPDIDSKDLDDPLTCADYVGDIFSYYRSVEPRYCVDADYMAKRQTDINAKMRAILIDWLVEVHQKFKLLPDTLFLTVNIIDRFLQKRPVTRKNLQLVGVTAMLLAAKYEEIWPPEVRDFVYISDQAYTREQILDMEKLMLNTLRFNMTVPTPLKFLARYFKAANLSQTSCNENTSRQYATYLTELAMLDYGMLQCPYSLVSAAAVYVAWQTLGRTTRFPRALHRHAGYPEAQVKECASKLVVLQRKANATSLVAVFKKHSHIRYGNVARVVEVPAIFINGDEQS